MGKSQHNYEMSIGATNINVEPTLKILGVTLDCNLSFKQHASSTLKKVYAKIAALRRIRRLVPTDTLITLYKTYVLPHFEYCCPLLLVISKTLNSKIERANHYALRTLLKLGNTVDYEYCLKLTSMETLKRRRIEHTLILFFKCYVLRGPSYISNLKYKMVRSRNCKRRFDKAISQSQATSD